MAIVKKQLPSDKSLHHILQILSVKAHQLFGDKLPALLDELNLVLAA